MYSRKKVSRLPSRRPSSLKRTSVTKRSKTSTKRSAVKPNQRKEKQRFSNVDWSSFRIWGVAIFFTLLWGVLLGRAYYVQIVKGPEYAQRAERQHTAFETIVGNRGTIMDRNGNILAHTVDAPSIAVNSVQVRDPQKTSDTLAEILNMPREKVYKTVTSGRRFAYIKRKVDYRVAQKVREAKLHGISLVSDTSRVYPYHTLAGQLIGFVGTDGIGLEGLEKSLDETLRGQEVKFTVQRDASGRRLRHNRPSDQELRGRDIVLSIDANIQYFAEESLQENIDKFDAKWGGCIVVDVPSGDILAWAQYPFFDPNKFNKYKLDQRRNRLATDALEQGSTIKSFVIAAALEEGLTTPDEMINCQKGRWRVGKNTIHDTKPYDFLPVKKILHVSSNIGIAKIGQMLGIDTYHDYLSRLGFGHKTDLPLAGESRGILHNPKRWQEIDLVTASFGQSISATMLQMAQAYHVLANDGVKKPLRLLLDDEESLYGVQEERIFSQKTMAEIRSMLRETVEEGGTGKRAHIPGLVIGGKTGTAQKAARGGYGAGRVASFVGMLPIEDPQYLILVLLDEPKVVQYGGIVATPIFKHVALNTMAYRGQLPDSDDPVVRRLTEKMQPTAPNNSLITSQTKVNLPPVNTTTVPHIVGFGVQKAVKALVEQGVVPTIIGSGSYVLEQSPSSGTTWAEERKCTIWIGDRL